MNGRTLAAVAILAGLAGAAGYYVHARSRMPQTVATTVSEAVVPASRLVATVPEFTLVDRDGVPRSLQHWAGKSLIVNFWATWCAPCRREIPLLETLQRERGGEGFQVVGIAVDFRDKVLAYADEMNIAYPLLIGEQEGLDAAAAFGVDAIGFPFTIFSDSQARIVAAHMGELTAAEADLILGVVVEVNAGRLSIEQGRARITAELPALQHEAGAKIAG